MKVYFYTCSVISIVTLVSCCAALAQSPNAFQPDKSGPVYQVVPISRTLATHDYTRNTGTMTVELTGTSLLPKAHGQAKIERVDGQARITADLDSLKPATRFGHAYLTYVLWAVSTDGRRENLGEFEVTGSKAKISTATDLTAFALLVTAEPDFAVKQPGKFVIMENVVEKDRIGDKLAANLVPVQQDPRVP